YNVSLHVLFTPIEYAVTYEDGNLSTASISLIREDNVGRFWLTYKTRPERRKIHWFVSINGIHHGMKIVGDDLVFYTKRPATPADFKPEEYPLYPF
ncbi:MAG: hypothetical protein IID41_00190, partial [Planctomycetes bacterium]|nr:hypothetical protein [Planctomycetota bacterium]